MDVRPVQKRSVSEDVVDQIRGMIESGELKIGDRLPAERRMAEMFLVSRNTVREAIRALAESGVLESRQGSGTYVSEAGESRGALIDAILRSEAGMHDVFEARKMIEPEIAALAAQKATLDEIARLEVVLYDQKKAIDSGQSGSAFDQQFHELLADVAGNVVLKAMITVLHESLLESRSEALQSTERQRASLAAHRAIVEAVRDGQGMRAERAMREHLEEIENIIFSDEA